MTASLDPNQSGVAEVVPAVLRCLSCQRSLVDKETGPACSGSVRMYLLVNGDWYSPWYQSKHTYEVCRRIESRGLETLRVIRQSTRQSMKQAIAVQARKLLTHEFRAKRYEKESTQCVG